jgi:two-component system sensor histidine kinase KdpD
VSQRWVAGRRPAVGPDAGTGAPLAGYVKGVLVVALCTGVAALMQTRFERANLIMVYLLGVLWAAVSLGRGPAVLASLLAVASFDFFFVPPGGTLAVSDPQYLVTFAVMLLAAFVIATLAARLRTQVRMARIDERRAEALARLSGELVALREHDRIAASAVAHLRELFERRVALLLPDDRGRLAVAAGDTALMEDGSNEHGVAQWAFDSGHAAGRGTDTLQEHRCLHLPLRASGRELGVIAIANQDPRRPMSPGSIRLLEAFANQVALALERATLADQAESARVQGEAERLRSGLLSSVSHDLRTPLAVITGAASTLLEAGDTLPATERNEMLKSVAEEATRLNQLVGNLLAMTRLEGGALEVRRSWHPLEEIIGAALHRIGPLVEERPVRVDLPPHLPLVAVDDVLL